MSHLRRARFSPARPARVLGLLALGLFCIIPSQAQQRGGPDDKTPRAEFHMARLVYADTSGGRVGGSRNYGIRGGFRPGWWAIDYPAAELHFLGGVRRLSRIDAFDDSHHIQLTEDAIFDHPWLFAQQVGQWRLNQLEIERLREYLLRGGFLVVDDFHGTLQWKTFTDTMSRVFPGRPIVDLDTGHEVFHVLYDLDQLTQIPGDRHLYMAGDGVIRARLDGPQRWAGIYDDEGRLMVAINFNMDMGDAWEHADDPYYPEPMTALAYRFGLNYLIYAMTH